MPNDLDARAPKRHLTNEEVLAELYEIRDSSIRAWKVAAKEANAKDVIAMGSSLEKALGAIKQSEGIAAAKAMNAGSNAITIAGFNPLSLETEPAEQAEA